MTQRLLNDIEACRRRLAHGVNIRSRDSLFDFQRTVALLTHCERLLTLTNALAQFTADASLGRAWPSAAHFVAELVDYWWQLLEEIFGNYERPSDETACSDTCFQERQLALINAELRVYGCVEHGTVHLCTGRDCAHVMRPKEKGMCMFSGAEVQTFLSSARCGEYSEHGDSIAGFKYAMSMREFDLMPSYSNRAPVTFKEAEELFEMARRNGKAPIDALAHKLESELGRESEAAAAARNSYYFGVKRTGLIVERERLLRSVAQSVIDDVLFNKHNRQLFNEAAINEAHLKGTTAVRAYYMKCRAEKNIPNQPTSVAHFATPFVLVHLIPLVENSRERSSYFATLCTKLWVMCHASPYARGVLNNNAEDQSKNAIRQTACTFEQFCLAVLYQKRYGLEIEARDELFTIRRRHVFVNVEKKLRFDLPPEDRVDMFGKRSIAEIERHLAPEAKRVAYGDNGAKSRGASKLFHDDGRLRVRKEGPHKRVPTSAGNSSRTITIAEQDVPERQVVPPHLSQQLLTTTGEYSASDITHGRNFLVACLNSIPSTQLEKAERSLAYN
jgi:hypothetical protein